MKINKDEIRKAWTLTINASSEKWVYSDGCVKNYKGEIIAYLCVEGTSPNFQQEVNGEFIAAIHNCSRELLETISHLISTNERLRSRVLRLESELYDNQQK